MKIKPFNLEENKRLIKINKTIPEPLMKLNDHCLFVAPTNSGKSTIVSNLLLGPLKNKFDSIHIFSPTYNYDIYPKLMKIDDENIHETYEDKIIDDIMEQHKKIEEDKGKPIFTLLIFDDFQELFSKGSYLENFICRCRHYGITIWILAQYIKAISRKTRQQFTGLLCFPALSNEEDLNLISETAPGSKKMFFTATNAVNELIKKTNNVHNFLWINKKLTNKYWFNFEQPIF
jgi:hypothetical protein